MLRFHFRLLLAILLALPLAAAPAAAEDGYDLWLRYRPLPSALRQSYTPFLDQLVVKGSSPALLAARQELKRGLAGLIGSRDRRGGLLLVGTPRDSQTIARLELPLQGLGQEGFVIRSTNFGERPVTVIAANGDVGILYGAFAFLRLLQTGRPIDKLDLREAPKLGLRILDHWDNLDRSVERGYAGASLWDWHRLPGWRDPRYVDYARVNASIGINGTVLTNVNANAQVLTPLYLEKVAALARIFRAYGIRVYLTARFSAPIELGGLATADPLDPKVRAWWKAKAGEIYRLIPDFGGFLVKANSEGQPGPQDYGRTHADGANMLADSLKPHGGIVMWRAFVYSASADQDRAKQAFEEFAPLDGRFRDNVLLQVKNGPIDFQPREPFHPLFGAMKRTPVILEAQITKEYLGFATHLAYLGTMWEEVLGADTFARGPGTEVAETLSGMAGVANVGADRNWSGSHFDQANWYAFGRLAWDPSRSAGAIAGEWARMTWGNDPAVVAPIVAMMMGSRQAVVDYMTPLGLHHLMATGHHYGPGPWVDGLDRPDWNPTYYHRADRDGIGFDRTAKGSNAVAQYASPVASRFGSLDSVPDDYLLWFHRVGWDHRLRSGRTLWQELVLRYSRGVEAVRAMRRDWAALEPRIDRERFEQVAAFLAIQEEEAKWWRDASIAYFRRVARRPLPEGFTPPARSLEYYKSLRFPYAPGQ